MHAKSAGHGRSHGTRAAVSLLALCAAAAAARAQGYEVEETTGRLAPRPADAVAMDLDEAPTREAPLPFGFPYYGEMYSRVLVSRDGWLRFPATGASAEIAGLPLAPESAADGAIAPLWCRYRSVGGVWSWTVGAASERRFVVAWERAVSPDGPAVTFQVHLHEDGRIAFAYASDAALTGTDSGTRPPAVVGLDEPAGVRFIAPVGSEARAPVPPATGFIFAPRTVLFNPPGSSREGSRVTWQDVRREAFVPLGSTRRCTYLARGKGYFLVPDRVRDIPGAVIAALREEDRETFGGDGDPDRWVRQVLDGKVLLVPARGGDPVRVWFRIVEFFSVDDIGFAGADHHTWNLRWMVARAFPDGDPRGQIEHYCGWRAMASSRLTVGKLFPARVEANAGRQFSSGRIREYVLWSGRLRAGPRGALGPEDTPGTGWNRFTLVQDDLRLEQHADAADLRFVPDPNYIDGRYTYVIRALDNSHGWVVGGPLPPEPLRSEGMDHDPPTRPR